MGREHNERQQAVLKVGLPRDHQERQNLIRTTVLKVTKRQKKEGNEVPRGGVRVAGEGKQSNSLILVWFSYYTNWNKSNSTARHI